MQLTSIFKGGLLAISLFSATAIAVRSDLLDVCDEKRINTSVVQRKRSGLLLARCISL
jgi:hypothetical protein